MRAITRGEVTGLTPCKGAAKEIMGQQVNRQDTDIGKKNPPANCTGRRVRHHMLLPGFSVCCHGRVLYFVRPICIFASLGTQMFEARAFAGAEIKLEHCQSSEEVQKLQLSGGRVAGSSRSFSSWFRASLFGAGAVGTGVGSWLPFSRKPST